MNRTAPPMLLFCLVMFFFTQILASNDDDKAFLAALDVLQKMDDQPRPQDEAPLAQRGEQILVFGLLLPFLDLDGLIKMRRSSKDLYRSREATRWLGLRLNDQIYHQFVHPIPRRIDLKNLPQVCASEIRCLLCMRRRLLQPKMSPSEAELSFIERGLAPVAQKHRIALAYLPALRGDVAKSFERLKALADAGDLRARVLVPLAKKYGELGQPGNRNLPVLMNGQLLADFGKGHAKKLIVDFLYKGVFGQGDGSELIALKDIAARGGHGVGMQARIFLIDNLYDGDFGTLFWSGEQRFLALKEVEAAGDDAANRVAQTYVVKTLFGGGFCQWVRPWPERMKDIEEMAKAGKPSAQEFMANFIIEKHQSSVQEKLAILQRMAREGNPYADRRIADQLYSKGALMWGISDEERLAQLEAMASAGCCYAREYAQMLIVDGLFEAAVDPKPGQEGGDSLESLKVLASTAASKPNLYAQELVNSATSWLQVLSPEFRCPKNFIIASQREAREFVNCKFLAATSDEEKRRNALNKIMNALLLGGLGQLTRPEADRFAELCAMAKSQDPFVKRSAENTIGFALARAALGQRERPRQDRLAELQAMAVRGNRTIQYREIPRLREESSRDLWLWYDFYDAMLEDLCPESDEGDCSGSSCSFGEGARRIDSSKRSKKS